MLKIQKYISRIKTTMFYIFSLYISKISIAARPQNAINNAIEIMCKVSLNY